MSNQYHTTATAAAALHNPHLTRLDFHTEKKSFATQPNTSKIESFRNYKHLANETCSNNTAGIRFHFAPRCTAELPYPESIILPDNPFNEKKNSSGLQTRTLDLRPKPHTLLPIYPRYSRKILMAQQKHTTIHIHQKTRNSSRRTPV